MNYKCGEPVEVKISMKSCENANKAGLTHLLQIAPPCFPAFPPCWNVESARESDDLVVLRSCALLREHWC